MLLHHKAVVCAAPPPRIFNGHSTERVKSCSAGSYPADTTRLLNRVLGQLFPTTTLESVSIYLCSRFPLFSIRKTFEGRQYFTRRTVLKKIMTLFWHMFAKVERSILIYDLFLWRKYHHTPDFSVVGTVSLCYLLLITNDYCFLSKRIMRSFQLDHTIHKYTHNQSIIAIFLVKWPLFSLLHGTIKLI